MSDKNKKPSKFSAVAQRMQASESVDKKSRGEAPQSDKATSDPMSSDQVSESTKGTQEDLVESQEVDTEPEKRATTIYLREDQLVELKVQAARTNSSMTSIISELVDKAGYCDEKHL